MQKHNFKTKNRIFVIKDEHDKFIKKNKINASKLIRDIFDIILKE